MEAFPGMVRRIFLIAPDGIKTSFWYSMATYPVILRRFFRSMIGSYERFEKFAALLHRLKLVDQGLLRFADYQMGTHEKRQRVYFSWVVFRHLRFDIGKITALINTHRIRATVITGRYDKVILPDNMKRFVDRIPGCQFEILDCGHSGLIYESLRFIRD
jgi:pimeloyl-ACP methyl ester carboxylesterase